MPKITTTLIKRAMIEDLNESAIIKPADIKKLAVKPLSPEEVKELTGFAVPAYSIPYFSPSGKKIKFDRLKLLAKIPGRPDQRYFQATNTIPHAYLPPVVPRRSWDHILKSPHIPIYITEGEKKAACACIHNLPTIGLGGVWSFKSKKAGLELIPELDNTVWTGRKVSIVYDNDVMHNPDVMKAMKVLASTLRQRGVSEIKSLYLRHEEDEEGKLGLDDFIRLYGPEALDTQVDTTADVLLEELSNLNKSYAVIRTSTMDKVFSIPLRQFVSARAFTSVIEAHKQISLVDGKGIPKRVKVAAEWLGWPNRRVFDDIVFEPGIDDPRLFNLWEGHPYEPRRSSITPFIDLLNQVFPNKEEREWFLKWVAYPLQNPGTKLASCILVWGPQGTGKTFLGEVIKALYGKHGYSVTQSEMVQDFNEWAVNKQFILADEVVFHGDRRESNALKNLITRKTITINQKYQPTYTVNDYTNYFFTANHSDAVYMEADDRRFLVVESGPKQDDSFYNSIDKATGQKAFFEGLLYYLLADVSLQGFLPLAPPPFTESKKDMIHETMSSLDQVIDEALHSPDAFFSIDGNIIPRDLYTADEVLNLLPAEFRNANRTAVGKALRRHGVPKFPINVKDSHGITSFRRVYAVRDQDKWKKASTKKRSAHYEGNLIDNLVKGNVVDIKSRRRKF